MLAAPASLVSLAEPWASFYGDSHLAQTVITFAHVGGLLVGGGAAIAADRATLRAASDVDRRRHLLEVSQLHRLVIGSLVVVAGCKHVAPYEREKLARPGIDTAEREAMRLRFYAHLYDAREGATGSGDSPGGGCGCN